ncbi:MAG: hypothetical protein GY861_12775 [bacterium]|nr:hypothetical protein [bacterium]
MINQIINNPFIMDYLNLWLFTGLLITWISCVGIGWTIGRWINQREQKSYVWTKMCRTCKFVKLLSELPEEIRCAKDWLFPGRKI